MSEELPPHKVVDTISKVDFKLTLFYGTTEEYFFSVEWDNPLLLALTEDGIYFFKNNTGRRIKLVVGESVAQAYFGDADVEDNSIMGIAQEFMIKSCGCDEAYIKVESIDGRIPFYSDLKHFTCSWRMW